MLPKLKSLYAYLQILSIDIVLGACAGMMFFDRLLGAELKPMLYLLLAMAVWCIYTFDHLLDARQIKKQASTTRHAFHQKHFKLLTLTLILVSSFGLGAAFYSLKIKFIIFSGVALGGTILLMFVVFKAAPSKSAYLKEISISSLYVGGIMLAPYFHNDLARIPAAFWLLGLAYILVAWFNTLYLGVLDRESDQEDGLYSFALAVGKDWSLRFLSGLMVLMLVYITSLFWILHSKSYFHICIILIIALIHSIVFLQDISAIKEVRRKLDASFMLPFIMLLI